MENKPIEYPDDTGKMDGWRKEDWWTSGEIQETVKRTAGPHNGHLRSHFTQRRIRRWTIVEKERDKEGRGLTDILYRIKMIGTKDYGPLYCRS